MAPLAGTRVVEPGVWVAGPSVGGVLADWGADVVKVEAAEGDPMRRLFQVVAGHGQSQSPPFDLDNRGKRSLVLDLRSAEGGEAMRRLIDRADVFITNLRPDAVERLGLGPEALLGRCARLVYVSVSGYGLTGPDAHRPAYDVGVWWARSGIAASIVPEGHTPFDLRGGLGDHVTGMAAVAGTCAALLERERTGRGQLVDTSLLRTGIWCIGWDVGIQLRFGKRAPTVTREHTMNPMLNPYEAGDGRWFWLLGLEADRHWPAVLAAIERPGLADDERFADARARRKNGTALVALLDEVFASRPRDEWFARFDECGVWWSPLSTLEDVVVDPQALATGAFVDVPEGEGAPAHRAAATPVRFGDADIEPRAVPGLGEHTDEVLAELGLAGGV